MIKVDRIQIKVFRVNLPPALARIIMREDKLGIPSMICHG